MMTQNVFIGCYGPVLSESCLMVCFCICVFLDNAYLLFFTVVNWYCIYMAFYSSKIILTGIFKKLTRGYTHLQFL